MEVVRIVPGCYHVEADGQCALFGAPPEILKILLNMNRKIPDTVVLPSVGYASGTSQVALEFLVYWHLFVDKPAMGRGRFRVVGNQAMWERVKDALQVTLFGPTRAQLKRWKLSKGRISLLCNMMDYLAIEGDAGKGKATTIDDIVEFAELRDDAPQGLFRTGDVLVRYRGGNRFVLTDKGERESLDLTFSQAQLPVLLDPEEEPETPQVLRIKLLGTYSGFDREGPTTGVVMWINCNGFLVDGPIGTSRYLQRLGLAKSDIAGIVLSHVHDDHCTLMDMILSEQIVNIITTREIYECMLIKVSNVLGESVDDIRRYLVFTEVIPGKPCSMFGARWEFFYTAHSIPTVGFRVTVKDTGGKEHSIVHSSDTCSYALLDEMQEAGAITVSHADRLKQLVRGGEDLAMIDGGGPPIHGNPSDYDSVISRNSGTDFVFYHVNPRTVDSDRYPIASPGWGKTYIEADNLSQALVLKLLKTMKLLEVEDFSWVNIILSQGRVVTVPFETDIVKKGQRGDDFFFILAGTAEVLARNEGREERVAVLENGDFFGEMSIICGVNKNATVRSVSSCVLFQLPGDVFVEFVEANGLKETFERLWLSRSLISSVRIFRNLHPHAKHQVSLLSTVVTYNPGDYVLRQGGKTDDFYVITRGSARIVKSRSGQETVQETLGVGEFFGENVAMGYSSRRNASVVAGEAGVDVLRLPGNELRTLAENAPVLIHELHLVMRERGIKRFPVVTRESTVPVIDDE